MVSDLVLDTDLNPDLLQEKRKAFVHTQLRWLGKRKAADAQLGEGTPEKLQRKTTYQWLRALNHCLDVFADKNVMSFLPEPDMHPTVWPSLTLSSDQGSDCTAAFHFLLYKLRLNVTMWPDQSHQWQRDILNAWGSMQWRSWVQLLVVPANLAHGPFDGGSRHWELQHSTETMLKLLDAGAQPFLIDFVDDLVDELDLTAYKNSPDLMDHIVTAIKNHPSLTSRGSKVAMCRFASMVDTCASLNSSWTLRLLRMLFLASETGQLTEGKLQKTIAAHSSQIAPSEGRTTVKQPPSLRKTFNNNLALSIAVLSDFEGRQRSRCIEVVTSPLRAWYGKQSKELRSLDAAVAWVKKQVSGGLLQPLLETFRLLSDPMALRKCEIGKPETNLVKQSTDPRIQQERVFSHAFGGYCLALVSHRLCRQLWLMQSFIPEMVKFLSNDAAKQNESMQYLQDLGDAVKVGRTKGAWWQSLLSRSFLTTTPGEQFFLILESNKYKCKP